MSEVPLPHGASTPRQLQTYLHTVVLVIITLYLQSKFRRSYRPGERPKLLERPKNCFLKVQKTFLDAQRTTNKRWRPELISVFNTIKQII